MTKLNWRDPKDYEYTKKLDTKGWAWEFIRRGEAYQNAYAEMKAAKKGRIPHPPKKNGESNNVWMMRVADRGEIAEYLTPSQIHARKWRLRKMCDPHVPYSSKEHHFDLSSTFPMFYGEPPELEEIKDQKQRKAAPTRFKKNPKLLAGLRPLSDLCEPSDDLDGADSVFIAFDANRPLRAQIKKASALLSAYQKVFHTLGRKRPDVWARYLRMLDAEAAEGDLMTQQQRMKIIDPKKCATLDYNEINDYASETLKAARKMASKDYKNLLLSLSVTK